ncbi:MAG: hypothetical protein A2Y63_04075 [Candidatus Riflebacteria bacterium RBG_13_59_9]|nr:MAG: hypothetical protein A2Y63_04075 [Candidatus Riflebacteria bacterium RBG_13_59_9]
MRMDWRPLRTVSEQATRVGRLLFPPYCIFCGELAELMVCAGCRDQLARVQPPICPRCGKPLKTDVPRGECLHCSRHRWYVESARALLTYEGRGREALHRFKYGRKRGLARFFGTELAQAAGDVRRLGALFNWDFGEEPELVVPMPLHPRKQFWRGFNQSELVLRFYAPTLGLPVGTGVLRRVKSTRPQVRLNEAERFANIRGAFAVPRAMKERVAGKHILLLDDMVTTGATMNAAARALQRAGAGKVYALSLYTAALK